MSEPRFTNKDYLTDDQYKSSTNLAARIRLHELYTRSQQSLHDFMFEQILDHVPDHATILEIGAGRGDLWRAKAANIPDSWDITLTDLSAGMLADNKAHLGTLSQRITYQVMDAQDMPFEDNTFDAVFAMYMLYHVPDLDKAIAEIRRVLKPDGVLFASTNGVNHMKELFDLVTGLMPNINREMLGFTVQNGASYLEKQFAAVKHMPYESDIWATDAQPVLDYIASMMSIAGDAVIEEHGESIRQTVDAAISEHGGFQIQKETGMFIASGLK